MSIIILWFLTGLVCSIIDTVWEYQHGRNFTTKDIPWFILGIFLGPVFACVLVIMFLERTKHILTNSEKNSEPDLTKSTLEDDKT